MTENEQIDERLQASAEYQRRKKYVYRIAEAVSYKGKDDHEDVWSILYSFQKEIERDFLSKGYCKDSEVARGIFEDIEENYADYLFDGSRNIIVITEKDFAELKKKYTEGEI